MARGGVRFAPPFESINGSARRARRRRSHAGHALRDAARQVRAHVADRRLMHVLLAFAVHGTALREAVEGDADLAPYALEVEGPPHHERHEEEERAERDPSERAAAACGHGAAP